MYCIDDERDEQSGCRNKPPPQPDWRKNAELQHCGLETFGSRAIHSLHPEPVRAWAKSAVVHRTLEGRFAPVGLRPFQLVPIPDLLLVPEIQPDELDKKIVARSSQLGSGHS